ncbi:hypothetical protein [Lactobacillus delbrueckii]|uniref:hypothetical protein n=1 Tax=Lactobacillus delbrueckii TaxID=1584 RepID=UPI000AA1937D|nr:hypothetical protein [Lactobacillus delbrueckii]
MSRKYKLRWQDRGILIALLATIIACVADRSKLYYKRAEEDRALQAAKLVARSFGPSLAQTTVNTKAGHIVVPRDMDRVEVWLKKFTAEAETGDVHKLTYHVISQNGQEIAVKANFSMVDNPLYGKLVYQTMTMA